MADGICSCRLIPLAQGESSVTVMIADSAMQKAPLFFPGIVVRREVVEIIFLATFSLQHLDPVFI
jgi:hypothetical protein